MYNFPEKISLSNRDSEVQRPAKEKEFDLFLISNFIKLYDNSNNNYKRISMVTGLPDCPLSD